MLQKYGRNLVNVLCFLLGALVLIYAVPKLLVFFMPFVVGWIISMIANPLVKFLERRLKIVRKHSSMLVIFLVIGLVVLVGYLVVAKLVQEIGNFLSDAPQFYEILVEDLEQIGENLQGLAARLPEAVTGFVRDVTENFTEYLGKLVETLGGPTMEAAGNMAKNIPSALIHIIFTILSAYFFIAQRDRVLTFVKAHVPDSVREKWSFVLQNFKTAVGGYFKAQFKIMGVIAVILLIGFLILGIDYAVLWAILISFLDMLPIFGTGTALGPWAVMKVLSGDYTMALGLVIIYAVSLLVHQLIQPKMVGDSLGLDPLLTLIFMHIGYKISSVFGMIIAVPLGMILVQLYQAGAFDDVLQDVKELAEGLRQIRKKE
ncbi:MAG: sporulation integral membrane protein YtvI [Lachnospiraceae bacterium]|nr:sporulation integral membrane protein YtvI [Lachnospiraceae bacterium]